ncbi:3-methyladenine DNA glycosylase AlkD [Microbacterium azadirachtae]|uniref:3-methyladenine DNA glycosylase AlkD n=1 Tax=Microbacterium azadirachtae TaxID=582680 RepID=A0A1I6GU01_9MICO|nr:DNA alkylation repair protein [Microbacterium azadirachtae]SFR45571.1 3-methyladenine DNA glycosylase AlkD [Microbacterium azadirachtae]
MTSSSALATEIREALRAAADPALAPGQQAYMKSAMPFLGVRVPDARRIATQAARGIVDVDELRDAALDLWRAAGYREERYAAQALMALKPLRGRLDLLDAHEEMIRTGAWWDHVDEVAHRLADLLDAHPAELSVELRVWADDEDLWIRRAAIIAQLQRKDRVDHALLSDVIEANLGDEEFFIRKAIGWALRDHARADPDWVRAFVDAHPSLSPLSRREALKHLG